MTVFVQAQSVCLKHILAEDLQLSLSYFRLCYKSVSALSVLVKYYAKNTQMVIKRCKYKGLHM